jgi:two-component system chemotaxis response regulator CheY
MATKQNNIKILVIEHDVSCLEQIRKDLLAWDEKVTIKEARDLHSAFVAAGENTYDICLLNLNLPDSGGVFTLKKFRPQVGSTPLIVFRGASDEALCAETIRNGAADYLSAAESKGEIFLRAIRKAYERTKWTGEGSAVHEHLKRVKIGVVRDATRNMVEDLHPSVQEIHERVGSLQNELLTNGTFTDAARVLLNSTQSSAKGLKGIVDDLVQFGRELSQHIPEENRVRYRILVVEDEPQVSEVIVRRLQKLAENEIETANNGQEAFNKCIENSKAGSPYHIVISDWRMPRMTGIELLEKLRKHPIYRGIPFMMISAVDDREDIQEAVSLKVSQYLLKPFTKEDFDKRFKRLMYYAN